MKNNCCKEYCCLTSKKKMKRGTRWGITVLLTVCIFLTLWAYFSELNVPLGTLVKRHRYRCGSRCSSRCRASDDECHSPHPDDVLVHHFDCLQVAQGDHPGTGEKQRFVVPPEHCVHHNMQRVSDAQQLADLTQYMQTGHMYAKQH